MAGLGWDSDPCLPASGPILPDAPAAHTFSLRGAEDSDGLSSEALIPWGWKSVPWSRLAAPAVCMILGEFTLRVPPPHLATMASNVALQRLLLQESK